MSPLLLPRSGKNRTVVHGAIPSVKDHVMNTRTESRAVRFVQLLCVALSGILLLGYLISLAFYDYEISSGNTTTFPKMVCLIVIIFSILLRSIRVRNISFLTSSILFVMIVGLDFYLYHIDMREYGGIASLLEIQGPLILALNFLVLVVFGINAGVAAAALRATANSQREPG